jgi:hypothetical protein
MLRKVFGLTGDEKEEAVELHKQELHELYSSPNIMKVIISTGMKWLGHVAYMWEKRYAQRFFCGKPEGKSYLKDIALDWSVILKCTSKSKLGQPILNSYDLHVKHPHCASVKNMYSKPPSCTTKFRKFYRLLVSAYQLSHHQTYQLSRTIQKLYLHVGLRSQPHRKVYGE